MIIPAIDIRGGQCVRLLHGNFDSETVYPVNLVDLAREYAAQGAPFLHIVDLDAARHGSSQNQEVILEMVDAASIPAQVGGGIRDVETASHLLASGVQRVVLGSVAMKQPDVAAELLERFGSERVCVALDVRPKGKSYNLTASGWLETISTKLETLLEFYVKYEVAHVLITDVSRDGAMTGPNVELYRKIKAAYPTIKLQASGGVRSVDDLLELREAGASYAIVGRALLEGTITFADELAC